MRIGTVIAVLVTCCLVSAVGRAEEADPGADVCTRDLAIELRPVAERLMRLASGPLEETETLDSFRTTATNVRKVAAKTRCAYPQFSDKDRAIAEAFVVRAEKWADAADARLAAEDSARTNVIVPICQATWMLDQAKADIAHERANPSGVHDLRRLHSAGEVAQHAQESINALKPQYLAHRKHPFARWQSEGACVAASRD